MEYLSFTAEKDYARADVAVTELTGGRLSRSAAAERIKSGDVTVDGKPVKPGRPIRAGEVVDVEIPEPVVLTDAEPEDIPLDVVFEDADVIVVNKPRGLTVHPAPGNERGTLVNALLFHCRDLSGINGTLRPGIVHRIDKDTTGLLIVAKNDEAHRSLADQIRRKECSRVYLAVVEGNIREDSGVVDAPIARDPRDRKRMAVVPGGRDARTHYEVLERFGRATLVRCRLETGRTHQIRVHMKHLGHPLLGDPVYGSRRPLPEAHVLSGQALHAVSLTFTHPRDGRRVTVTAPPDPEMESLLALLRARASV
ncbi:MAG: RluA family pseudouridine synthase [Eubacteriales bacterium]|nr:RluA family pseudouridine synthase [Eubacteriales bacterium]